MGLTMRESDYGLDLLSIVVEEQLKPIDFACFDAAKGISLLRQHILEEIKHCNRGCSQAELGGYIAIHLPRDFPRAALLIAECLGEFYHTGELVVYEYRGKTCEPQERHIRQALVTGKTTSVLL